MSPPNLSRQFNICLYNPSDIASWAPQNEANVIKPLAKCTKSAPGGPEAPKRFHIKNHYKTTVKVNSARSHVFEPQVLFQICNQKKLFVVETVCKVYHFAYIFF